MYKNGRARKLIVEDRFVVVSKFNFHVLFLLLLLCNVHHMVCDMNYQPIICNERKWIKFPSFHAVIFRVTA